MKLIRNYSLKSRRNSFIYAFNGWRALLQSEPNARIHIVATVAVIIAAILRNVSIVGWIALLLAIALVWVTEMLNTCIEKLCDFACENKIHPSIKVIKDIAAGAVLAAAIISVAIGGFVFLC